MKYPFRQVSAAPLLKYTAGHRLIKVTKIITQSMMLRLLLMAGQHQPEPNWCRSCGYDDWLSPLRPQICKKRKKVT
jgi:hypothetical protein